MVLEKTIPLIPLFLIGYFLKRFGVLKKEDGRILSKILFNLVIPILILNIFSTVELSNSSALLPIAGVVTGLLFLGIGWAVSKILFRGVSQEKTRQAFVITFPTFEGGIIAYVFALAAFGTEGLSRVSLFDFGTGLVMLTVVYSIACAYGIARADIRSSLRILSRNPIIWGILAGTILNLLEFNPPYLTSFANMVGGAVLLLAMLLLGLEMEPKFTAVGPILISVIIKAVIGIVLSLFITLIFGFTGMERIAVFIGSLVPVSTMTLIYARENNLNPEFVANLLSIALPLSIILLNVFVAFI